MVLLYVDVFFILLMISLHMEHLGALTILGVWIAEAPLSCFPQNYMLLPGSLPVVSSPMLLHVASCCFPLSFKAGN